MPVYLRLGSIPAKRHTAHRRPGGFLDEGIYYEEVVTLSGFGRAYSIVYHLRPPTRVASIEPAGALRIEAEPQPILRHHHLLSNKMERMGDPIGGRVALFFNDDVVISRCRPISDQQELFRNASADEVIFVHEGRGTLRSMFGDVEFRSHDYLVIPRCTTYSLEFERVGESEMLVIEGREPIDIPARYRNPDGQIRLGAPYGERDFRGPMNLAPIDREGPVSVMIKDGNRLSRYTLAHHPFDVVGWDGMVYPFAFNADDFEPITGTVHQPPPVHQTFDSEGFVICTFAPRMLDTHPDAIKIPYAHSNVQADEVLYYVAGRFGSRKGVGQSSLTLHPRGIPHGPHPGTILASRDLKRTDELAVMIDTERPLFLTKAAVAIDDPRYPLTWME
jgi:homogentisate 1,2-dioxygenase